MGEKVENRSTDVSNDRGAFERSVPPLPSTLTSQNGRKVDTRSVIITDSPRWKGSKTKVKAVIKQFSKTCKFRKSETKFRHQVTKI
jgi:hypothetical protein